MPSPPPAPRPPVLQPQAAQRGRQSELQQLALLQEALDAARAEVEALQGEAAAAAALRDELAARWVVAK